MCVSDFCHVSFVYMYANHRVLCNALKASFLCLFLRPCALEMIVIITEAGRRGWRRMRTKRAGWGEEEACQINRFHAGLDLHALYRLES